jgi:hypothetical protein
MANALRDGEPSTAKKNPARVIAKPAKQEIIITRDFDAQRELVFRAFTDPDLCAVDRSARAYYDSRNIRAAKWRTRTNQEIKPKFSVRLKMKE